MKKIAKNNLNLSDLNSDFIQYIVFNNSVGARAIGL